MSRQRTPSHRTSWFRPTLEPLEDRIVPSEFGDLLTNFGSNALGNIVAAEGLIQKENADATAFQAAPRNFNNLVALFSDSLQLTSLAAQVSQQVQTLAFGVSVGKDLMLVTGLQASVLDTTVTLAQTEAARLTNAAEVADGDFFAALFAFLAGRSTPLAPIPTVPSPSGQTQTNGTVSESIANAPATASKSGGVISQSVTVTNPSNTPVMVTESYSATDGTSTSMSDTCTNGSITVTAAAPPSAPGVVGTWTTTVTGLPTQTNTTTWTQ
jgi:hypothetical protein